METARKSNLEIPGALLEPGGIPLFTRDKDFRAFAAAARRNLIL
jgi:hypothetical protein